MVKIDGDFARRVDENVELTATAAIEFG